MVPGIPTDLLQGRKTTSAVIRVRDIEEEHDSIVGLRQFKFVGFGPDYGT